MIKKIFISLLLYYFSCFTLAEENQQFGTGADITKLETISTIIKQPEMYLNKTITVQGEVAAVCQKRGCWLEIFSVEKNTKLRIKVTDGEIVFPLTAKGKMAFATGILQQKSLNKTQAQSYLKHMAEDKGQVIDVSKIEKGMILYQLNATGVSIVN